MFRRFTPFAVAKNVYEIDISFFVNLGIKYVVCDLDNTLDAYYQKEPSQQAIEYKKKLDEYNITLILTSNNVKNRVKRYSDCLGVSYLYSCKKPLISKVKKYLVKNHIKKDECIIIGDQVFTDVYFANRLKIKSILCDNLVSKDQFFTKINKFFDKYVRRYLKKHNKLTDWREL